MSQTNFQRNAAWLSACGKEVGNQQHISVAVGVHIEEFCELLATIRVDKEGYAKLIERCRGDMEWMAGKLKSGELLAHIPPHLRVEALDALCDSEITGNGVAHLAGFNKDEADLRVLASNESKLNEDGTPVILAGGKIGKSSRYVKPSLGDCV